MSNLHVERRADSMTQQMHYDALCSVTSSFVLDAPPDFPHLRNNPKRQWMQAQRTHEIDTENMILLGKMRSIFALGTAATNPGLPKPIEREPSSLNEGWRRREAERITRDNLGIVQRLRASRSTYSVENMMRERQKTEQILKRISRHGQRRLDTFSNPGALYSASLTSSTSSLGGRRSTTATPMHGTRRPRLHTAGSMSGGSMPHLRQTSRDGSRDGSGLCSPLRSSSQSGQMAAVAAEPRSDRQLEYGDQLLAPTQVVAVGGTLHLDDLRPAPIALKGARRGGGGKQLAPLHEPWRRDPSLAAAASTSSG